MKKQTWCLSLSVTVFFILVSTFCHGLPKVTEEVHDHVDAEKIILSKRQLTSIGAKIYRNETGAKPENLIAWNSGESFASLGIGHFIWFPKDLQSPFTETFPSLLDYLIEQGADVPSWLINTRDLPWRSKSDFQAARNGTKMAELQTLLLTTFDHQIAFIHQRMTTALPKMQEHLTKPQDKQLLTERFHRLQQSEQGLYALIDYVNFKGEGTSKSERYQGQGWGLLQVILGMEEAMQSDLVAFSGSCKRVLSQRVSNASQKEIEARWLPGWKKRCDTYKAN